MERLKSSVVTADLRQGFAQRPLQQLPIKPLDREKGDISRVGHLENFSTTFKGPGSGLCQALPKLVVAILLYTKLFVMILLYTNWAEQDD